jgi:glycosyltransferase involved in cell wall biosynthesis
MGSKNEFAINGRFLTQSVTGVQRYALNVAYGLNDVLRERGAAVPIIAPDGATDPGFAQLPLLVTGRIGGHAWEQFILPIKWSGSLLNLCNTAPVSKTQQILCIHDANVFIRPESYSRSFRMLYRALQPMIVRRSAKITTVSADSATQIAKYLPVNASKITVLPNGHEHALAWRPELARSAPSLVSGRRGGAHRSFVLAIGSRAAHKNMQLIMKVAPALAEKSVDVIVVGGFAKIFSDEGFEVGPNVIFTGRIDDNDLAFLMDHAACLLFPSWTEGFGLPIVEAMARGCAVVSSNQASMPEVCGSAALMAGPDDPATWVRHIGDLVGSESLREELAEKGRDNVKRFSWRKTAESYAEMMR